MANRRIQITVAWPWPPCVDHGITWLSMAQQVAGKPMGVPSLFSGRYGYGSIPINTIFRGMNIHLPAILMFNRGTRF